MKNFKISKKLIVSFGIVLVLLIASAVVGVISLNQVGNNLDRFYDGPFQVSNRASDMKTTIQTAAKNIGFAMIAPGVEETQKYVNLTNENMNSLQSDIEFMKENFTGDISLIDSLSSILSSGTASRQKVLDYALSLENEKASDVYFGEYQKYLLDALGKIEEINVASIGNAETMYTSAVTSQQIGLIFLIAISIIAVIITIIIAIYLTKSLTGPISEIEGAASKLAIGDLDIEIEYESQDELGQLAKSFGKTVITLKSLILDIRELLGVMANSDFNIKTKAQEYYVGDFQPLLVSLDEISVGLSGTMSEIKESSVQVYAASTQMADGASSLAEGATDQASAIQELLATIEVVKNEVNQSAKGAEGTAQVVSAIGVEAEANSVHMEKLVAAMDKINDSSKKIAEIIGTIEEIAEQTNLLSLNASIEAARAGEAGRGFAVVAGEIGKLAIQSGNAVNNTRELIETALREVQNGTSISKDAAKSLFEMKDSIQNTVGRVDAAKEGALLQSNMINEISDGIEQISVVVQNNSATAEESSATSEELAAQADTLADLVSKFKLRA